MDDSSETYIYIIKICSGLSFLSVFLVLIMIFKWGNIKVLSTELILLLMIIELFLSIGGLLPTDPKNEVVNNLCKAQAFIRNFFEFSSQILVCFLLLTAWNSINSTKIVEESKVNNRLIYFSLSFGIPGIICIL